MVEESFKRDLYEIEKKKNLSNRKKEKIYNQLVKLVNTIDKKKHVNVMTVMI